MNLFNYTRRRSSETKVGTTPLGKDNPIRIQSMTNTLTQDTESSVAQVKRIVDAGADYVRLTTQGLKEANNMENISRQLREDGYNTPLVADVHFNPKVADVAAQFVEKVRVNPGNYVDPARQFLELSYTEEEYQAELAKLRARFTDFLNICKQHHTAIRIGVNHGSLSDRIMSHYGDTPSGMVESCMEFLRICRDEDFNDVVISIKASNTVVMVQTLRLLVATFEKEGMDFPIHLGVTEAGEGEDGRIKSALGIGTVLSDGIGDTVRVSLSESPEKEIPVAKKLVNYITARAGHKHIEGLVSDQFNFLSPERRITKAVHNIGGDNVPVVIADRKGVGAKTTREFIPEYIYAGAKLPEQLERAEYILDAKEWKGTDHTWPSFDTNQLDEIDNNNAALKFVFTSYPEVNAKLIAILFRHPEVVLVAKSDHQNKVGELRALVHLLMLHKVQNPVIFYQSYRENEIEDLQIKAAADMGPLIIDGFCDGLLLSNVGKLSNNEIDSTAFSILQAGRVRTSKTEFISCPGCGRTLFSLEETVAKVKKATKHLKGLKIGIMGCIVNGPGEMADADYGYVGAGKGRISLYKRKECIEKNIPEEHAVERLIELIKQHGDYVEESDIE